MKILRRRRSPVDLDLTPLIDVVFQLLVFFMLAARFAPPSIQINLPRGVKHNDARPERLVIRIGRRGEVFVGADRVDMQALQGVLNKRLRVLGINEVHIEADKDMPYRYFMRVMDRARAAGARRVNLTYEGKRP